MSSPTNPKRATKSETPSKIIQHYLAEHRLKMRHFKLLVGAIRSDSGASTFSKHGGSYKGKTPRQAAVHAFAQVVREYSDKQEFMCAFSIMEVTKGKANKKFTYMGKRVKLNYPKTIRRTGGAEYRVSYMNRVHAYKWE